MSPDVAAGLLAAARTDQQPTRLKRNAANLEGYTVDDPLLLRRLAEAALTPEVDAQCLAYFGSEYYIHWSMLSRTEPVADPPTVSFMWHCDRGPSSPLKLLVYLNDHAEHGGGTSYLDRDGSEAVARSGYLFGDAKRRSGSLEELSALAGRPLVPYDHRPQAGDAVLFQPSHVLHRGITPTLGPRYVFTLCLLPSPVPWAVALERGVQVDLRDHPLWHANAAELERRFATA